MTVTTKLAYNIVVLITTIKGFILLGPKCFKTSQCPGKKSNIKGLNPAIDTERAKTV